MASPGWYPDPNNNMLSRYWDGTAWTGSTQQLPGGADYWRKPSHSRTPTKASAIRARESQKPSGGVQDGLRSPLSLSCSFLLRFRVVNRHLDGGWRMGIDGDGYRVTCQDGTVSLSGGEPGACSQHGGVR
jgi:hypothetical protein